MKEIISRVEVYFRLIKYSAVSVHRKLLESQLDWLGSQGKNNGCFDKRKKSNMLGLKFETDFSHYWWIRLRKNRWKCGRHQKLNPVVDTRFYSRRAAYYTCFNSEIHPETMARLWNAPTSFFLTWCVAVAGFAEGEVIEWRLNARADLFDLLLSGSSRFTCRGLTRGKTQSSVLEPGQSVHVWNIETKKTQRWGLVETHEGVRSSELLLRSVSVVLC